MMLSAKHECPYATVASLMLEYECKVYEFVQFKYDVNDACIVVFVKQFEKTNYRKKENQTFLSFLKALISHFWSVFVFSPHRFL